MAIEWAPLKKKENQPDGLMLSHTAAGTMDDRPRPLKVNKSVCTVGYGVCRGGGDFSGKAEPLVWQTRAGRFYGVEGSGKVSGHTTGLPLTQPNNY